MLCHRPSRATHRARTPRRGFTLLEFVVAMLLFGLSLSALIPLLVMQARTLGSLERGPQRTAQHPDPSTSLDYRSGHADEWYQVSAESDDPNAGEWVHKWYLVSSDEPWASKLGLGSAVTAVDPGPKPTPPVPTPPNLIADDGDQGYSESTGDWSAVASGSAYGADQKRHLAIDSSKAAWTFTNVPEGWYEVQATWTAEEDQVPDATYTLYDGATLLTDEPVSPVNQQNDPVPTGSGSNWQLLQTIYIASGTAVVELTAFSLSDPDKHVVADGMRLVLVENKVTVDSLERSSALEAEQVTARVKVEPQ